MSPAAFAASLLFPALLLWAAANDLARFEIPNAIPVALAAAFPLYAVPVAMPISEIAWHYGVGIVALAICAGLFFCRAMGGGDAKLIAAAIVWTGSAGAPLFVVAMALAGGALALALVLYRLAPTPSWAREGGWIRMLHARRREAPYGVAIAGGGLFWYFASVLSAG